MSHFGLLSTVANLLGELASDCLYLRGPCLKVHCSLIQIKATRRAAAACCGRGWQRKHTMSVFSKLAHQNSAKSDRGSLQSVSLTRATDIDEFLNAVRGYHYGLLQLDRGPFAAELIQTQLGGVLLTTANFARAVVQSGEPPDRMITFAVRMSPTPALWQGRPFGLHELIIGEPGTEVDLVSQPDYCAATASFPPKLVDETAETLGWALLPVRRRASSSV